MSKNKILFLRILITIVFTLLLYYIYLPPFNFTSIDFYVFLLFIVGAFYLTKLVSVFNVTEILRNRKKLSYITIVPLIIVSVFFLIIIINFFLSPVFRSKAYSKRIEIDQTTDFTKDVSPVNFNTLPLLDKDSSSKLGDRVMGQMPELVSQFYVSDLYTQINYNDEIIRVTPLEYDGIIKYFTK